MAGGEGEVEEGTAVPVVASLGAFHEVAMADGNDVMPANDLGEDGAGALDHDCHNVPSIAVARGVRGAKAEELVGENYRMRQNRPCIQQFCP